MRLGFPPGPIGDRVGSTFGVRETDSCWSIRSSVAFLVFKHNWRCSSGTRDGCRPLMTLVGTAGTGANRGGACEDGEWRTEEVRNVVTDREGGDGDGVLGSDAGGSDDGGATEWLREAPSCVYACAVCGPFPEEGNIVHRTPVPGDKG
jgi:hypothetical protein